MMSVRIEGLNELKVYLDGVQKKVNEESDKLPYRLAEKTKNNIKNEIRSGARWTGNYHRYTGTGLAESLMRIKIKKGIHEVMPNPALAPISHVGSGSKGGKGFIEPPSVYAEYVEYGHRGRNGFVEGRFYFEKGLNKTLKILDEETSKSLQYITR